jgi:tetratricopeptide (TPR) repeat protein
MMCAFVRDFDRAEQHLYLARAMNPNDAVIQLFWAWIQGVRGRPDHGLTAAGMAFRLNPRHPLWYDMYVARLHFLLGDYAEAAALLEKPMWDVPARHLRDVGWRVAAYGHMGRLDQASRCGEKLVREIASHWCGDPGAGPSDYLNWIVWASLLEQPADIERLREGLRLAGLPA